MDSVVELDLSLSLIISRIKEALACGLIAVVVSTGVFGITILQAYIYFRSSGKDSVHMRFFVAFLFMLDTVSLILAVDALYEYVVTDFGNSFLLLNLPRVLSFEIGITLFRSSSLVLEQAEHTADYPRRGFSRLIHNHQPLPGPGIGICVHDYTSPDIFSLASVEMRALTAASNGLSVNGFDNQLIDYLHHKLWGTDRFFLGPNFFSQFIAFPGRLFHLPFALLTGKCSTLKKLSESMETM
ncbi:hypothetical protein V8D89_009463 [Ganoderma adspersum]